MIPLRRMSLLDYGCGCGRILRHWRESDTRVIAGADYNPYFVDFLRKTLPFAELKLSTAEAQLRSKNGRLSLFTLFRCSHTSIRPTKTSLCPRSLMFCTPKAFFS